MAFSTTNLKRPGASSRVNPNRPAETFDRDRGFLDQILEKSPMKGYHNGITRKAPQTERPDCGNSTASIQPSSAPAVEKEAAVAPLPLGRSYGASAMALLHETLDRMVPITMKLQLQASNGSLVATLTGCQNTSDPARIQAKTSQHMVLLGQRCPDEPLRMAYVAEHILPFAEIAGYQGSAMGMGRPAVVYGSGMVGGFVKTFEPEQPFYVDVGVEENGELKVEVGNFSLSHWFGCEREKFTAIVAVRHMQQARVYGCVNEEDQEDFEAHLEEDFAKVKGEHDLRAKSVRMERVLRRWREDCEEEEAVEEEAELHRARMEAEAAAREERHQEYERYLEALSKNAVEISTWVEEEKTEEEIEEDEAMEAALAVAVAAADKGAFDEADEYLGDFEDSEDEEDAEDEEQIDIPDTPTQQYQAPTVVDEIDDPSPASSPEEPSTTAPPAGQKRKVQDELEDPVAAKKAKTDGLLAVIDLTTEDSMPPSQLPGQKRKAGDDQPGFKKVKSANGQSKTTKIPEYPTPPLSTASAPSPSTASLPSHPTTPTNPSWHLDDPASLSGYRHLYHQTGTLHQNKTQEWPNLSKPALLNFLRTHAPDYVVGKAKAKKQELQSLIAEVIFAYPVPGDVMWELNRGWEWPRHMGGVYARLEMSEEKGMGEVQKGLFRESLGRVRGA